MKVKAFALVLLVGCGGAGVGQRDDLGTSGDAALELEGDFTCPAAGKAGGMNTPGGTCFAFPPTVTGADPAGQNATAANYAVTPDAGANGKLVLFFNGSGGHPSESIANPSKNFFNAAAQLGYQVLAVSYRSDETIASQCECVDTCYFPSRTTVLRGVAQADAATSLLDIRVDESIAGRAALALRWLAAKDPSHGWSSYLTSAPASAPPETQLDWTKIVVSGHSQGGGHAAAAGKQFPVLRVIQLSSTCDTIVTSGTCSKATNDISNAENASWLTRASGTWATPAGSYYGLDIKSVYNGNVWQSGDGACFLHAAGWQAEGVPAAQQHDDGAICDATTIVQNHDASIECEDNFALWQSMLR